ncbi:hypothetical protein AURDEDRAFT_111190 [Auricularia subglabra TFB-10046 SS5]|nr:hypothetical protein AURDEDRAFT_111190 [Auricularia subglabra TFB-10046 SS5]
MQVDGIHAGIGRLSHELGIPPLVPVLQQPPQPPQEGDPPVQTLGNVGTDASGPAAEAPPPGGILQEMRQYLAENKGRQQQTQAELQAAMQTLVAGAAQGLDARADERQKAASDALFAFMEQQRQANEALLRGVATELSNDIRGERLRFVDAMKEATTVNIQFHVEEFKKQLTKEVLTMTIEVERLQRERQMLQMQISELFAFFSKQKQALALPQGQGASESRPLPQEPQAPAVQTMANLPPRRRRA